MSYKLYTDKPETFECKLNLTGASLKNSSAKMLIESDDINLFFKGKIDKNGKCIIPIKKLKGILDENQKGKMILEVVAEDTYFQAWQDDFIIDTEKKLQVEVLNKNTSNGKPKLTVGNTTLKTKRNPNIIDEHSNRVMNVLTNNHLNNKI